ncbi:MAG: dihydropteroate synthase [Fimbriimonadia bacterium]|nr:dihydropteroate synthase [Fimbriimonadia bacterium]
MFSPTDAEQRLQALWGKRTLIAGVLNVTPDSFYDGGRFFTPSDALRQAERMISEGADILDIGGESSRPGADPVPLEEELRRVIPVIETLSQQVDTLISIDTYKAEVARQALRAGAHIVNDISAMRADSAMCQVVAEAGAYVILMHMQGEPRTMQKNPTYANVTREVLDHLLQQADQAMEAGVPRHKIWLDPGIGFGKTLEHNLELLRNLRLFCETGFRVMIGASRKSFIGRLLGDLPPEERLEGALATLALAIAQGVDIVRAHDVQASVRTARIADAIVRGV